MLFRSLLELLPQASSLRWELIDALMGEALTAKEDWLSHNLIDLGKVLHVLLGQAPASLSPVTQQALATYAHQLTANLSPGQQAAILTALLAAMATRQAPKRGQRLRRLGRRVVERLRPISLLKRVASRIGEA